MNKVLITPRLKADLTLLLVAAVWGSGFVAQRLGADQMSALYFNGARFLLAGLILLGLARFRWGLQRRYLPLAGLAGLLLFFASLLQQTAIETTTVGNVAFITGLYVVAVPLLLFLLWRERTRPTALLAAGLAVAGVALLSPQDSFQVRPGDGLALLGALLWAAHVVLLSKLPKDIDSVHFAVSQFLACGALDLLAGGIFNPAGASKIGLAWGAVLYSAAFPTAVGFTLQVVGQRNAPATDASIVLSLEAVFGALFGVVFFAEGWNVQQLIGSGLILAAIILCQIRTDK